MGVCRVVKMVQVLPSHASLTASQPACRLLVAVPSYGFGSVWARTLECWDSSGSVPGSRQ